MLARLLGVVDEERKKKKKSRILRDYSVLVFDWKARTRQLVTFRSLLTPFSLRD